jgi:hypothetical protein
MAPPPSAPTVRVSSVVLNTGFASRGQGRRIRQVSWLQPSVSPPLLNSKPMKCYNRKMRDNRFLKVDNSLIAEAMSALSVPSISSGVVTDLVHSPKLSIGFSPSLKLVDSGEDGDFWGGEDGDFPYPLNDFPPATRLDWTLMGDPCKGIDVSLEVTLPFKR